LTGARRLVLVRHGESEWNAAGIMQGHGGTGLNERGVAQAEATAGYLHEVLTDVALIARSDLQRVEETAAPTERLLGVEAVVDKRLREIDVGTWTGKTREQVLAEDPAAAVAWERGEDVARGGAETFAALRVRIWEALLAALDRLAPGSTGLVFTHGGPIRVAVAEALALPAGAERRLEPVANCSLTVLHDHGGVLRVAVYNSVGHLTRPGA
jgi:glucosyl-3-phosphoglycerate phosphatase